MGVIRAIAVAVTLTSLSLFAGCQQCSLIVQQVTWPVEDADLQPLVDACTAHVLDGASGCQMMSSSGRRTTDSVECGCLALCKRLLEVIDQFSGREALIDCHLGPAPDAGPATNVVITYRPSTCP